MARARGYGRRTVRRVRRYRRYYTDSHSKSQSQKRKPNRKEKVLTETPKKKERFQVDDTPIAQPQQLTKQNLANLKESLSPRFTLTPPQSQKLYHNVTTYWLF